MSTLKYKILSALRISIFLLLSLFVSIQSAIAVNVQDIDLGTHANGEHTAEKYYYLIDSSNELELADVVKSTNWSKAKVKINNRGLSNSTSWMKFIVNNSSQEPVNSIFAYVDQGIASIDFYQRKVKHNTQFTHQNFTFNKPVDTRPVPFFRPAFTINLEEQESVEVFVKLNPGDMFPMHVFTSFRVWEENAFYSTKDKELVFLVILLCAEFFMALVTFIFYINTRDKVFLYYSIFAISAISLFASVSGLWGYFIENKHYEMWQVVLQVNLSKIAALIFVRSFLSTKKYLPKVDIFLIIVIVISCLGVVLSLAGEHYYSRAITDYTSLCFIALIPISLYAYKKGIPHSLLFAVSWMIFIVGMTGGALRLRGILPDNYLTEWVIYVGGLIEITLLLSILVMRLNKLSKEKKIVENLYKTTLEQSANELTIQVDKKTQELQDAKIKAENEARIDILSGLTNRRAFIEIAERAIARARRNAESALYLALIDIDYFKQVNDNFGHSAGDIVLKSLAQTLSDTIRETDVVSRIGGEEFSVIIENSTLNNARNLTEKLRSAVENLTTHYHLQDIKITISIGFSEFSSTQTLDELLNNSDKALYLAKVEGRNRVVFSES